MGEYYDVVYVAGTVYLVMATEASGYNEISVEMTEDQKDKIDEFQSDQSDTRQQFLAELIK